MQILILKIILFVALSGSITMFFYYLRQERVLSSKLQEVSYTFGEAEIKRAQRIKRNILIEKKGSVPQRGIKKYLRKVELLYTYSGLNRWFKWLTFEVWAVIVVASSAGIYFAALTITKDAYVPFLFSLFYILILFLIEKVLAHVNYKRVEENLLNFLNILENFNATETDIISILSQTARYMLDPLKTVLEDCNYEAQITGDRRIALYSLAEKIENASFKNLIYDLEICSNFSANFRKIIEKSRKLIKEEQHLRMDRRDLANELSFEMILLTVLIISAINIADGLLVTLNIWDVIFYTAIGHGCIGCVIGIYIFFFYKIASLGK